MSDLYRMAPVLILAFPFLGACIALFLERKNPKLTAVISTFAIGASCVVAAVVVFKVWGESPADHLGKVYAQDPADWVTLGKGTIRLGFHIDHLAAALLGMVTLCATMIHVFSNGYMAGDPRFGAFFRWIGFFTFSMLGLLVSDNLLTLFVCWELMGLSSYKLIGFFYYKESAYKAAIKAFMTTRIGDVGMFLGILLLYALTGSLRFQEIFAQIQSGAFQGQGVMGMEFQTLALLASVGLFIGAMGKSAQFPLHVWLPDAMEGPTPVSALIHAATMVAAGVYLVGRMYPLFSVHPAMLPIVCIVGTFTALFAGTIAVCATDIKKVLAYSTCSQLGFMFAGLGAGGILGYQAGMFHLVTHAFFKACLFLGSGSVIHAVHTQEIGQMGGLWRKIPVTFWTWIIATAAIAGVPFTAGFFSKDAILLALATSEGHGLAHHIRLGCMVLLLGGAFLTAAYMFRVTALTFFGKPREQERYDHAHESPVLYIPLVVLAVMAIAAGYFWQHRFLAPENLFPHLGYLPGKYEGAALEAVKEGMAPAAFEAFEHQSHEFHVWHFRMLFLAIPAGLGGLLLGAFLYLTTKGEEVRAKLRVPLAPVFHVWKNKYWIDEIYWATFVAGAVAVSRALAWFDREAVDGLVNFVGRFGIRLGNASGWADREIVDAQFVHGAAGLAYGAGGLFSKMQNGRVRVYVFQALLTTGVLALVAAAVYR
jgi:NADH-quinone oxidoreductase subunit L